MPPFSARALVALAMTLLPVLPAAARAEVHVVEFTGGAFTPAVLSVAAGDTLRVVNRDGRPHTFTANDGSYDSGRLMDGDATQIVLDDVGIHGFRCTLGGQRVEVHVEVGRGAVRRGSVVAPSAGYTHRAPTGPLATVPYVNTRYPDALGEPAFIGGR